MLEEELRRTGHEPSISLHTVGGEPSVSFVGGGVFYSQESSVEISNRPVAAQVAPEREQPDTANGSPSSKLCVIQ